MPQASTPEAGDPDVAASRKESFEISFRDKHPLSNPPPYVFSPTMLRSAIVRGQSGLGQGLRGGVRRQWQPQRIRQPVAWRAFADEKPVDKQAIPTNISQTGNVAGNQSSTVAGVATGPIQATATSNPTATEIPPSSAPQTSHTPSSTAGTLPPTGSGTASTGPASTPPPKRPRRRFRNFLLSLVILSTLGYAGGVYYSLVSDNFHDFFTEYVPFGEDAVAYFEEREFRKRFPAHDQHPGKAWPQTRGEEKVTIGKRSGLSAKVAEEKENAGSDLAQKGRHLSATEDNKPKPAPQEDKRNYSPGKTRTADSTPEKQQATAAKKDEKKQEPVKAAPIAPKEEKPASAPPPAVSSIDHLSIGEAQEPVVQDLVKILNNIITTVNNSSEAKGLSTTLASAKEDLNKVINDVSTLKAKAAHDADTQVKNAHMEFDNAAKELVRRLEQEMREQELKWREEYEGERERLSKAYQTRLSAELDAAQKVSDEKNKNALLEQEIAMQKSFMDSVRSSVESEREGRLSKLDELSSSVEELEKLTGEWNSVVDATLQTQHLQVALEAVRAKLQASDFPTPFTNELVALKEVSRANDTVSAAISSIPPVAYQRGIPSVAHLIDRFRRVASEVRKASLLPEDAGVASHAASAVLSRFMFAKKADRGLPEGEDVEATLARTEVLLEEGDLDAAAREMNALRGWAGVLSRDWVGECRRVLEVRQAVDVIATEARLQSLLVD